MTTPTAIQPLQLDRSPADYLPGDSLSVEASAESLAGTQTIELSIVWCTVGKGEEDLVVHDFRRVSTTDLDGSLKLDTVLPASPLSYAGRIVKVCWLARLRVFLAGGKQVVTETPFRLGDVQPHQAEEEHETEAPTEESP